MLFTIWRSRKFKGERLIMQSIQMFALASRRSDPGLFCDGSELTLGGVSLLVKTQSGYQLRSAGDLNEIFDAAYGLENGIDLPSRLSGLLSVIRALNKGDRSHAMMLALLLRLPNIGLGGMERLCKLSATATAKYDDRQPRDWHGRWTDGSSGSEAARVGPRTRELSSHLAGHWPDVHGQNPNIVLTQGGSAGPFPVPLFPPLFPGNPLNPQTPKKNDPPIIFPEPGVDQGGTGQGVNDNTAAGTQATSESEPKTCPDPQFELDSVNRTPGQLLYQSQISGLPVGEGVRFNGVDFDGCRESDGTLLEAKTTSPWFFSVPDFVFRGFKEYKDTLNQAFRQMEAAGSRKLEWHFSDPRVAEFWRNEFTRLDYRITVRYTPFIPTTMKFS